MSKIYTQYGPIRSVLVILILMMFLGGLANVVTIQLWDLLGYDSNHLVSGAALTAGERLIFRLGLMVNHFGMFLLPGLIFLFYFTGSSPLTYLKASRGSTFQIAIFWILVVMFSYPLVGYLTQVNESIPLPTWAKSAQTNAFDILNNVLKMESVAEFVTALILVGVLPALGEELIFRGLIQQKLIKAMDNPHVAILVTSILFGAIHFQLERLLPLSFLGLILGYSFYYTRSFWIPVLLHFFINGTQVSALYFASGFNLDDLEKSPDMPITIVLSSLMLTLFFFIMARRYSEAQHTTIELPV